MHRNLLRCSRSRLKTACRQSKAGSIRARTHQRNKVLWHFNMSDEPQDTQANLEAALRSGNADTKAAAQALTASTAKIFRDGGGEEQIESSLWRCWNNVTDFAKDTPPDQQDGIVKAVQAIQESGELKRDGGELCKAFGGTVWTDLPVFGAQMREMWNADGTTPDKWRNLNAFAARLTAASSKRDGPYDFALFGIWALRDALEGREANVKEYGSVAPGALAAAAMWMLYCADKLMRESASPGGRDFPGKVARAGPGCADKEWRGLNRERWILWKETLQEIISSEAHGGMNELLQKAVASMETAEQQSGCR